MQRSKLYPDLSVILFVLLTGCGLNLYESFVPKNSESYYLEETKILLDKKNYTDAQEMLNNIEGNSNDKLLMQVAIHLGAAGLSLWDIILDLVDNNDLSASSGSGIDKIFNLLSENVFGSGEVKTARLAALNNSIQLLASPPVAENRMNNLRCFLSGLLVLPQVNAGTAQIALATSALEDIASSVVGGGSNADECPDISKLTDPIHALATVQSDLQLALSQTANCSFLDFLNNQDSLNEIQKKLQKFIDNADQGCATIDCAGNAACEALQLGCVQAVIAEDNVVGGDGVVATCELMQNCRTAGSCF